MDHDEEGAALSNKTVSPSFWLSYSLCPTEAIVMIETPPISRNEMGAHSFLLLSGARDSSLDERTIIRNHPQPEVAITAR